MRKTLLFVVMLLLMHCVAFIWKVTPIPQEDLTLFYENRWVITVITAVLSAITGVLMAMEKHNGD